MNTNEPTLANRSGCGPASPPRCCSCWSAMSSPSSCPDTRVCGMIGAALLRADRHPVVAALQPRTLVRAPGRDRPDDRRGVRGKVCRPPVDCRRRDGLLDLRPRDPDPERRPRRLGGGEPSSRPRSARRRGGRRRRARMPAVDADADRWHQRRREVGFPLAVDDDSRGPAPGSGRRGAQAAPAGSGAGGDIQATGSKPGRRPRQGAGGSSSRRARSGRTGGTGQTRGLAWLSRTRSRQRDSRRADRDGLVAVAADRRRGAGRSARAGRPSPSTATLSTRRSSAAATRSSPVTGWTPASRCGGIATRRDSGNRTPAPVRAARRRSATVASIRSVRPES